MWCSQRARLVEILDLFVEDDQLNVYAGELEVRPPGAPTIPMADMNRRGSAGLLRLLACGTHYALTFGIPSAVCDGLRLSP